MQTIKTAQVLEPRAQSTRPRMPHARGATPERPDAWGKARAGVLRALRAARRQLRPTFRPYGEVDLVLAFSVGALLAACALLPFLPR